MDIAPNYSLIPYSEQDYQLKPYVPENPVQKQNFGQESLARHRRFWQPRPQIHIIDPEIPSHTYDIRQNLAYPAIDQVGHLIDIYA